MINLKLAFRKFPVLSQFQSISQQFDVTKNGFPRWLYLIDEMDFFPFFQLESLESLSIFLLFQMELQSLGKLSHLERLVVGDEFNGV